MKTAFFAISTLSILFLLLVPAGSLAAIEGRVTNPEGKSIWRARVEVAGTGISAFTDTRGRFTLGGARFPCEIRISHPRFEDSTVELPSEPAEALAISLEPKPFLLEEVVISGGREGREGDGFAPVAIAANGVDPAEQPTPPSTLTELVKAVPGVSENGQGGVFQVFSVRGVSRERVLTLLSGMRVVSERRAGVSTSFVDPLLMGSVDVLRGPSSSFYGSGALGGVIQVFPQEFAGWSAKTGFESDGRENVQVVGWGGGGWSVGLARREANNGESPDGSEINSHFSQYSATIAKRMDHGERRYEILVIPAGAWDIGKANTDFPTRTTNYPEERHLLAKLAITSGTRWRLTAFAHPNDLHTRNTQQDGERTDVLNDASDFGLNLGKSFTLAPRLTGRLGLDYFGRRGVSSRETTRLAPGDTSAPPPVLRTLNGGEQDEAALYGSLGWKWNEATIQAGNRFTWQRQENGGTPQVDGAAWNGFVGLVFPLSATLLVSGDLGSGFRFPSLSERFFTGTTGRGGVIGNPDLNSERSLNVDLGVRWQPSRHSLAGHVFRNRIEDYIERVELEPDLFSFENVTSGTITGLELDISHDLSERWQLSWTGHLIEGRAGDEPLADIPAERLELTLRRIQQRWRWEAGWEYRDGKNDPGPGEKTIPAAQLVSAGVTWTWRPDLSFSASASNLLDDEYFSSADEKVPLAPGRSLAIALAWGETR